MEMFITFLAPVGLGYFALLSCIWSLKKSNFALNKLLRDTNRQFAVYRAASESDYPTARLMAGLAAKNEPEKSEKEEEEIPQLTITQRG